TAPTQNVGRYGGTKTYGLSMTMFSIRIRPGARAGARRAAPGPAVPARLSAGRAGKAKTLSDQPACGHCALETGALTCSVKGHSCLSPVLLLPPGGTGILACL